MQRHNNGNTSELFAPIFVLTKSIQLYKHIVTSNKSYMHLKSCCCFVFFRNINDITSILALAAILFSRAGGSGGCVVFYFRL